MDFYKQVAIVTLVILIISLAIFGYVITEGVSTAYFPSYVSKCPEYWKWDGENKKCVNINNMNLGNGDSNYVPSNDICTNKKWAANNRIVWDGVTNTNRCAS